MPQDTPEFQVSPDVITTMMFEHGLRPFDVPYRIEGKVRVYATDAEGAKALVDRQSPLQYAADGTLETFAAEAIVQ